MAEFVPDQVKATYQSVVGKAGETLSDIASNGAASLPNPLHSNSSYKAQADDGHRNARAEERHTRHPDAPKDIEEFVANQLDGKIDNEKLVKQFPAKEGVWEGFIDWENNPDKKEEAAKVLEGYVWPSIPEFQLNPLPSTNPILLGHRWKAYHKALGPHLTDAHEESWKIFKEEKRDNMLVVLDFPMNCEPRREDLMKSHITPNDIHYVRNHGGIPTVKNTDVFSIKVGGLVKNPGELFFKDLVDPAKFPQEEMTITLQCSGTRRVEQIALYPGEGDELLSAPWAEGAISTALYKGVQMKHVLAHFGGVLPEGLHVETIGADTYFKKNKVFNYAVSIPYRKVKFEEAFLAYEMNGVPLPRIHGGPLRLVVPGVIGARSTKWVYEINVLPEPSMGPVQRQEYLYYPQQVGKQNVTYDKGFSIQDMPVSSAILVPKDKEVIIHDGFIHCEGWAYSGGGHWVERVEVSIDGGFIWHEVPYENMSPKGYYTMRLWKMDLPVPVEGWIELVVRAWNDAINTQPTIVRNAWNWTLHVTSSAHRVPIYSVNRSKPETAARLRLLESHGQSIKPITFPTDVPIQSQEEYLAAMAKRGPREPTG